MNYKKIKVLYVSLFSLSLLFVSLSFINLEVKVIDYNLFLLIGIFFMIPGFVFKLLHEQKYPPTKKQKIIGWILAIILTPIALYADKLINFISDLI